MEPNFCPFECKTRPRKSLDQKIQDLSIYPVGTVELQNVSRLKVMGEMSLMIVQPPSDMYELINITSGSGTQMVVMPKDASMQNRLFRMRRVFFSH